MKYPVKYILRVAGGILLTEEYTMNSTHKKAGKLLSLVFTVALVCLIAAAIIPVVNAASAVDLGSAGNYAILSKSGISTTGTTTINGNIGVSPIDATAITGFGLAMDSSNQFSRSSLVSGGVYAANYAPPTPATMTSAVSAMEAAYTNAANQAPPVAADLYAGNLGGKTLTPGVYKWSTGVLIPASTVLKLDAQNNAGAVWIFQVSGDLTLNSAAQVALVNGANANNVYWQVAGSTGVIVGSGAHVEGNLLTQKAITLNSGASLHGRALAQTAVTLIANTITSPASTSSPTAAPTDAPTGTYTAGTTQTYAAGITPTVSVVTTSTITTSTTANPHDTNVTANVGGDSWINQAVVNGTGHHDLVVTGFVQTGPPEDVPEAPGTVYQYINLVPSQYTTIDQAVISFKVPYSWLEGHKITDQNVVLYHLDNNVTWTALPTTLVEKEGGRNDYTATSPGFSLFAITGQDIPATAVPTTISATLVPTVAATAPTVQPTESTPLATPTKAPVPAWLPVTAVMGALLIMGVLSGRKGK